MIRSRAGATRRQVAFRIVSTGLVLALGACGPAGAGPLRVAVIADDKSDLPGRGAALVEAAYPLRAATIEGLVGFDADGRVVPALAERWIVTDDGLTTIFRLRDGTWADGAPLTAETVAAALRNAIASARGGTLGFDLAPIRAVRVMAGRVVELDLASPLPDLLTLLAQPELGLVHDRHGTGPMGLRGSGSRALLALLPPARLGLAVENTSDERDRPLHLTMTSSDRAIADFGRGDSDLVLGGTAASLPLVPANLARSNLQFDPVIGLFGLVVAHGNGFLADAPNREALAMAINREALVGAFQQANGWQPTTRIVSPGLDGDAGTIGERWSGISLADRRAVATDRVGAWRRTGQDGPRLTIALPDGPGATVVFDRLKADFAAIGVTLARVPPRRVADLYLIDRVARYARPEWFLGQLTCAGLPEACNPAGDALLAEVRGIADSATRARRLSDAEAEMTAANGFIPLARPLRWSLVGTRLTGFAPNPWGWHPLLPLIGTAR